MIKTATETNNIVMLANKLGPSFSSDISKIAKNIQAQNKEGPKSKSLIQNTEIKIKDDDSLEVLDIALNDSVENFKGNTQEIKKNLLQATSSIPLQREEVYKLAAASVKAGATQEELGEFTAKAAKIAVAFGVSTEDMTNIMKGSTVEGKYNKKTLEDITAAWNKLNSSPADDLGSEVLAQYSDKCSSAKNELLMLDKAKKNLSITVGSALIPFIRTESSLLNSVATKVANFTEKHSKLSTGTAYVVGSISSLNSVMELTKTHFGNVASSGVKLINFFCKKTIAVVANTAATETNTAAEHMQNITQFKSIMLTTKKIAADVTEKASIIAKTSAQKILSAINLKSIILSTRKIAVDTASRASTLAKAAAEKILAAINLKSIILSTRKIAVDTACKASTLAKATAEKILTAINLKSIILSTRRIAVDTACKASTLAKAAAEKILAAINLKSIILSTRKIAVDTACKASTLAKAAAEKILMAVHSKSIITTTKSLAVGAAYKISTLAGAAATAVMAGAMNILNIAMTANPIGLIIVGVAALIAGFVLAYKHFEKFRNFLKSIGEMAKKVFSIFKIFNKDEKVKQEVELSTTNKTAVNSAPPARNLPPGSSDKGSLPKFAKGGMVTKPTVAMIGEGGDSEMIIPLNSSERSKSLWEKAGNIMGLGSSQQAVGTGSGSTGGGTSASALVIEKIEINLGGGKGTDIKNALNEGTENMIFKLEELANKISMREKRLSFE